MSNPKIFAHIPDTRSLNFCLQQINQSPDRITLFPSDCAKSWLPTWSISLFTAAILSNLDIFQGNWNKMSHNVELRQVSLRRWSIRFDLAYYLSIDAFKPQRWSSSNIKASICISFKKISCLMLLIQFRLITLQSTAGKTSSTSGFETRNCCLVFLFLESSLFHKFRLSKHSTKEKVCCAIFVASGGKNKFWMEDKMWWKNI